MGLAAVHGSHYVSFFRCAASRRIYSADPSRFDVATRHSAHGLSFVCPSPQSEDLSVCPTATCEDLWSWYHILCWFVVLDCSFGLQSLWWNNQYVSKSMECCNGKTWNPLPSVAARCDSRFSPWERCNKHVPADRKYSFDLLAWQMGSGPYPWVLPSRSCSTSSPSQFEFRSAKLHQHPEQYMLWSVYQLFARASAKACSVDSQERIKLVVSRSFRHPSFYLGLWFALLEVWSDVQILCKVFAVSKMRAWAAFRDRVRKVR